MRRAFVLAIFLAGCRKTSLPPSGVDASVSATTSASAPTATSATSATASAAPIGSMASSPTPIASDGGAEDAPVSASAVAGFPGGGIIVYARPDSETKKSDVLARTLDGDGRMRGPARLLRKTSGSVESLSISIREDAVWVAWASNVEEKILAAVVRTDPKLEAVSAPVTIVHEGFGSSQPGYWARVIAVKDGGAVVVTRDTSMPITCMFQAQQPNERCTAGTYVVKLIAPDGRQTLLARQPLDGNPIEVAPLVDIGGMVVVRAYAWHGGGVSSDQLMPYSGEGNPKNLTLGSCRPGFEQAFTGDELITLCALDYLSANEKCPTAVEGGNMCPRILRAKVEMPPYVDAGVSRGTLVRSMAPACDAGHPVMKIVQGDGSSLLIDPTKPGASVPQLAGWTGKVLLEARARDSDMSSGPLALRRRACRGNVLVDLP